MSRPTLYSDILEPQDELERLLGKSTQEFVDRLRAMVRARVEDPSAPGFPARGPHRVAMANLVSTMRRRMLEADYLGRKRIVLEMEDSLRKAGMDPIGKRPVVVRMEFAEAMEALISREPIAVPLDVQRKAEFVSRAYSERNIFAIAKSADVAITKRIQGVLRDFSRRGRPTAEAVEEIRSIGEGAGIDDFTRAYAENILRTNMNTAYSSGRFQEAADPDVRGVMPAFEYQAIPDSRVRDGTDGEENHLALNGLVMATNDPRWDEWAPPNGYSCLKPDAPVLCVDGVKRIDQVRIYDLVVTHKNRIRPVVGVHRQRFAGDMVRIIVGNNEILVTPEHKMFTDEGWKFAKDLTAQDKVLGQRDSTRLVHGFDSLVANVGKGDAMPAQENMTRKEFSGSFFSAAFEGESDFWKPEINPEGFAIKVVDPLHSDAVEPLREHLLEAGHSHSGVDMLGGVLSEGLHFGLDRFTDDFGVEHRGAGFQFLGFHANSFVGLLGLSEGPVLFSSKRSSDFGHMSRGSFSPLVGTNPLIGNRFGSCSSWDSEIVQKLLGESVVSGAQKRQQFSPWDSFFDVPLAQEILQWFVKSGLDRLDRLFYQLPSPGWERISTIDSVSHDGVVFNLSVAEDESYIAQGLINSNCRCNLRLVSVFELRRRGLLEENGSVKFMDVPDAANAHPNFRQGRPDFQFYFGVED